MIPLPKLEAERYWIAGDEEIYIMKMDDGVWVGDICSFIAPPPLDHTQELRARYF